jgi:hypothetical protein
MPISANAVPLGRNQSRVSAVTVTSAANSFETVLVNHGLGKTPDKVRAILRCLRSAISAGPGDPIFLSANASTALLQFNESTAGALAADYDIDCEIIHTVVR